MFLKYAACLCLPVLLCIGCAHYPVNAPLDATAATFDYRFEHTASPTNSPELLLMLTFSGGGTRSAALAYGVLEQLAHTQVGGPANEHQLLDEVDVISAVSGGSFTAAYYALYGDRIFSDFEARFLTKRIQSALLCRSLWPHNAIRLASPRFDISDLAAEYYDRQLFHGATFGDLAARPGRPFLIINATDIAQGLPFEFTQDQFELLHSDLSCFPISRAVAASSAFPVWLSPLVLKNYSSGECVAEPEWIGAVLSDPAASQRQRKLAQDARSYLDGKRRFIHLLDGGIIDNLGLRNSLDKTFEQVGRSGPLRDLLGQVRRIAIISVDAHVDRDHGWDRKEPSPGLPALLDSLVRVQTTRNSFETMELFKERSQALAQEIQTARFALGADEQSIELRTYFIELRFNDLADQSDRQFFNSVPTRLQLPARTVECLRGLAATELARNPEFQRLVQELGPGPIRPPSTTRSVKSLVQAP